jgi:hypothetical protein
LEKLPLVQQIAQRADPLLAAQLVVDHKSPCPFGSIEEAARQLAGRLDSTEEAGQILGPCGPKLSAANLHPWIWNAAVDLWDDGHRREAVQAAATALFDQHLPAKLGVPGPMSAKDRISQAFQTSAPTPGKPRLRLDDYSDGSPNWTSQHEDAQFFDMGWRQHRGGEAMPGSGCTSPTSPSAGSSDLAGVATAIITHRGAGAPIRPSQAAEPPGAERDAKL